MTTQRKQPNEIMPVINPGTEVSFSALKMEQNNQVFYIITIPKEEIFPYCYISDRNDNPKLGFQRELDISRSKSIAQYLDGAKGSIPTTIVLSAQECANIKYDSKNKTISFNRIEKAFLVIDGQHRLYGYWLTQKNHRVPVSIYVGLTRLQEVALFIDINTTQRGVSAALLLDIKHMAERETSDETKLRDLFNYLSGEPDSPFFGVMSPAKNARGKIARPAFNRAVMPILKLQVIEQLDKEHRNILFKNYLKALDQTLQTPQILRTSTFLESFCAIFEDVLRLSYTKHSNYKFESLLNVIAPFRNIELSKVSSEGRARLTKSVILPLLHEQLFGKPNVDSGMI